MCANIKRLTTKNPNDKRERIYLIKKRRNDEIPNTGSEQFAGNFGLKSGKTMMKRKPLDPLINAGGRRGYVYTNSGWKTGNGAGKTTDVIYIKTWNLRTLVWRVRTRYEPTVERGPPRRKTKRISGKQYRPSLPHNRFIYYSGVMWWPFAASYIVQKLYRTYLTNGRGRTKSLRDFHCSTPVYSAVYVQYQSRNRLFCSLIRRARYEDIGKRGRAGARARSSFSGPLKYDSASL